MAYKKHQIVAKAAMFKKTMMASLAALAISAVCMADGGLTYSDSLKQKAESGDATAQSNLARCYEDGLGVKKDAVEAHKWFLKAAKQNDSYALYSVGWNYAHGAGGVKKDVIEAAKWYRKSAERDNAGAQFDLGNCYWNGNGVEQNKAEAIKWYTKSAENGNIKAQKMLGAKYFSGDGVREDRVKAAKWFRKAAERDDVDAQLMLGLCYFHKGGNLAEAVKWFRKAAEKGEATAQYALGLCYFEGKGVAENVEEAFKWLSKSAKQGNKDAKEVLKKPEFQFISAFRNADDMEAGEVCLQKLKEFKNDGRFSKTTNASPKKNALIVKGMYLGMPIDDAVVACGEIAKKSDDYFVVDSRMLNEPEWSKYKPLTKKMKGLDGVCIFTCKNSATGKREKLIQDASLMCRACMDKKGAVNQFYFTKMGIDEIFKAASQTSEEFAEKLQEEYPQIATFDQSVKDKQEDGANKREYRWTYRSELGYSVELYENAIIVHHDGEDKEIRINDYRRIMANDPNAVGVGFGASQFNKYLSIRMNAKGK